MTFKFTLNEKKINHWPSHLNSIFPSCTHFAEFHFHWKWLRCTFSETSTLCTFPKTSTISCFQKLAGKPFYYWEMSRCFEESSTSAFVESEIDFRWKWISVKWGLWPSYPHDTYSATKPRLKIFFSKSPWHSKAKVHLQVWLEAQRPTWQRCGRAARWTWPTRTGSSWRSPTTESRRRPGRGIRDKEEGRSRWWRPSAEGRCLPDRNCSTASCWEGCREPRQGCSPLLQDEHNGDSSAPSSAIVPTWLLKFINLNWS